MFDLVSKECRTTNAHRRGLPVGVGASLDGTNVIRRPIAAMARNANGSGRHRPANTTSAWLAMKSISVSSIFALHGQNLSRDFNLSRRK